MSQELNWSTFNLVKKLNMRKSDWLFSNTHGNGPKTEKKANNLINV